MTKERIVEIHGLASNGIMRPELAANMLPEVCEVALELFKIVEQQNARLEKCSTANSLNYDQQE